MKQQASLSTIVGFVALGAATVLGPLTSFDAKAHDDDHHGKDKVEVEGTVSQVSGSCPNLRFTVGDTQVVAKDKTRYDDGTCKDVKDGQRVEVKGKLNQDGTLSAYKVDLDD
jgi:cytochrome c-type biogenesis protein CcmE